MHWSSWIHSLFLVGFTCFIYLTSFHEFLQFYSFYQFGETQKILPCYDYIIGKFNNICIVHVTLFFIFKLKKMFLSQNGYLEKRKIN